MKILVIAGGCLSVNSSANLCHLSYINGLLDCGHNVDLIAVSNKDQNIDESIKLPSKVNAFLYDGSMYARLGALKSKANNSDSNSLKIRKRFSLKKWVVSKIKWLLLKYYGVYGTDKGWLKKAKKFKSKEKYDVVLSLSYPPVSHRLAECLIKSKRIKTDKWIQLWEDPWYTDIFGYSHTPQILKEEKRLLKSAQYVFYVSPLTLMYQQKAFPEYALKMHWQPLPSYYVNDLHPVNFDKLSFGYFGDYLSHVRNLQYFYDTAKELELKVTVCGRSDLDLQSTKDFKVLPRLPIDELKIYEDQTNVLIFVCNLRGGQIPGKIYQYSATNKLILFILDGTDEEKAVLKDFFQPFNRYIFCDNNCEDIKTTINKIQEYVKQESYTKQLDNFSSKIIIDKIITVK